MIFLGSILVLVNRQKNNVVRKPSFLRVEHSKLIQLNIWDPRQIIWNEVSRYVSLQFCMGWDLSDMIC